MRLALFASGGGSNAQAILDAIDSGMLPAEAVVLITDRPGIGALDRAERAGLPHRIIQPLHFRGDAFADALNEALEEAGADFIALAGYLKMIPRGVTERFRHRILNIHPSLLPAFGGPGFYGRRVHQAVLDYGCRWTGATVHLVDDQYDSGPVVLQEPVPVEPDDTAESLAARVLRLEHRLYPEALRLFASGRVEVHERSVTILPQYPTS